MSKIALVYYSQSGVTAQLTKSAMQGVKESGSEALLYEIKGSSIIEGRFVDHELFNELHSCDAIVFSSPTYMGGVAAQFKAFADATSDFWETQLWSGKLAAGITCGSNLNGDQSSTLQYLTVFASQHGMCWVNLDLPTSENSRSLNRLGCQLGIVAQHSSGILNEFDVNTAKYLGARVAKLSQKIASS